MVSIDKLSREELTTIISQELHIDVAFPCFSVEEQAGATACCVVHKHWLATLRQSKFRETTKIKRYPTTRSPLNTNNNNPDQTNDYRQAPTTNVLVSVFLKRKLTDNARKPLLYARKPHENINPSRKLQSRFDYPLRYFLKEQHEGKPILDLVEIEAQYENYVPIIFDKDFQNARGLTDLELQLVRQKAFVEKFIEMLYPECAYFKILPQQENDVLSVELHSQPDWSSDMPITTSPNLIDVFAVLESDRAYYFIAPYRGTTLQDLLKYSSGVLNSNVKKSFILYQLLRTVQNLHKRGVIHGGLKTSNILVDENLWITLTGFECSVPTTVGGSDQVSQSANDFVMENIPRKIKEDSLTMKWVHGDISNFDYIMALNNLAGRRIGDPNFHPIFPWITDFTGSSVSENWRDEQLDFTFDGPVPHHITDILSDITYYVYLARKTPIPVLCQYVRTKYEPNEYPSSLQRLFEWTPDECIPEFYTDPSIFTSIHPDMPDLQLPSWAPTANDFIRLHAEALESDYVSKNLHLWIDLTFGCRLSGDDAVEAKNVALPLLDGQNSFMKHGITQLFSDPHPQKIVNSAHESVSVTNNDSKSLLEKYESISCKKRIPSKLLETNKMTLQQITEISNELLVGSEKTVGKYQTISSCSSPRLSLALHEIINADEKEASSATLDPKDPNVRIEAWSNLMNSLPIYFSDEISEDYFTNSLDNFERAHVFSAKYPPHKFMSAEYEQSGDQDGSNYHQRRDSTKVSPVENTFAYGKAWDTYCLGKIIKVIYSDLTDDTMLSLFSTNQETDQMVDNRKLPLSVQGVVSALLNPDWTKRPSIDALIYTSVPVMSLHDTGMTLPLPECIPEVYEFLTDFHQVDWIGRLKLAEHWMSKLCKLIDEAFFMILPSLVLLFTQDTIKIEALNIFSKLGQRLGQDETKNHLLKPIVSLFESSRPSIPQRLFDNAVITSFVHRFGVTNFLQQLFPLYLEALTIEDSIVPMTFDDGIFMDPKLKCMTDHEIVSSPTTTTNNSSYSLDNALPSVAQLANSALVTICTLIGPILASKHIMKQLYKMLLKESTTLPFLMQSILAIGNRFGETFTHLQFAQVIAVIQQYSTLTMNKKNYSILCNHLFLLEKLTTLMPSGKVLSEIDSLFSETLIKLLVQFNNDDNSSLEKKGPLTGSAIQIIKNRFSVSVKTVELLLHVCNNAAKSDWEKHIAPILQKYFESYGKSLENLGMEESERLKLEQDRNQQIIYAYSQFCILFDPESVRQTIPESCREAIELAMNGSAISGELSSSVPARPPSLSCSPDNHVSSDRVSVKSMTSYSSETKASSAPNTAKFSVNFEDKKHLTLGSKDVASIISMTTTTSSSLSVNRAFSSFSSEGASKKLAGINHQTVTGVSSRSSTMSPVKSLPSNSGSKKTKLGILSWRTKSQFKEGEDLKNWNRFLSTNSEEMMNALQFTFNDLKLRTFSGHTSAIRSLDISEHNRYIVSGSKDRTVKLWSLDIHSGIENLNSEPFSEYLISYGEHKKPTINDVHFISGGISWGLGDAVASSDGQIHLWDPETGRTLNQIASAKPCCSMKPIFKSRCLVGGIIRIICVNPSETLIAVGFSSGVISLLESRTGTLVGSWKAGDTDISQMKFHGNNYLVSYAQSSHLICIWDTDSLSLSNTIRVTSEIAALNMYKEEVITVNNNNSITFSPLNENFQQNTLKFKSATVKSQITCLGILPINKLILLGCAEGDMLLYA
ncbi:12165_t:CDS:10 [Acaulospora morrowiae]|uniref:12165_t:CDS:1 n=1 Tax=Acaulospora morrowiae TaxID=94023 RepID=A0A9N8WAR9_9GLOM|nr:12165_t:CDS:10 [Acaulospora morrowiae]